MRYKLLVYCDYLSVKENIDSVSKVKGLSQDDTVRKIAKMTPSLLPIARPSSNTVFYLSDVQGRKEEPGRDQMHPQTGTSGASPHRLAWAILLAQWATT
jgi:hypothetical protein